MIVFLVILQVAVFIASGFIKSAWLKIPTMLAVLCITAYSGVKIGMQIQTTKFISDFLAPLAQFGRHLDEIKDDQAIFTSKVLRWNETLQTSNYQIEPVRDKMFKLIEEPTRK